MYCFMVLVAFAFLSLDAAAVLARAHQMEHMDTNVQEYIGRVQFEPNQDQVN